MTRTTTASSGPLAVLMCSRRVSRGGCSIGEGNSSFGVFSFGPHKLSGRAPAPGSALDLQPSGPTLYHLVLLLDPPLRLTWSYSWDHTVSTPGSPPGSPGPIPGTSSGFAPGSSRDFPRWLLKGNIGGSIEGSSAGF